MIAPDHLSTGIDQDEAPCPICILGLATKQTLIADQSGVLIACDAGNWSPNERRTEGIGDSSIDF